MKRILVTAAAVALGLGLASAKAEDVLVGYAGPFTGQLAENGAQLDSGIKAAAADINAAGGVNGKMIVLEKGDDQCDPKQAVAVAGTMVSKKVAAVIGHFCSGSSIPASAVYQEEGIFQISAASTNPKFTEQGFWNTHRVCGRDDAQGAVAGAFLAKKFAGQPVAILHDKSAYGKGLAEETQKAYNKAGGKEVLFDAINAGEKDYTAVVSKLKDAKAVAVYLGGYHPEAGLLVRQMREQGLNAQLVMGDSMNVAEFWTIAGDAGEGTIFTFAPDPQNLSSAKAAMESIKKQGGTTEGYALYGYAALQTYAAAAKATGGFDGHKIAEWLRASNKVDTVIGQIALDKKGDVLDAVYVWYNWSKGKYAETSTP